MAQNSPGRRHRSRGLVFTVLLCVYLVVVVGMWAAVAVFGSKWAGACTYLGTLALMLLGLYLPGQDGRRGTVRRALVLVPSGMAGCMLIVGMALDLDYLSGQSWMHTLEPLVGLPWGPVGMICGGILGAVLIGATGRLPLGRLFMRCWLVLFLASGATSVVACVAYAGFLAGPQDWSGLEAVIALGSALVVLSWTVAFGLAVGATRDRNAAPAGPPGGADAPEPPRAER